MSVSEIKQLERDLGAVIGYLSAPKLSAVQLVIRKAEAIKRLTRMLDEAKFLKQQTKCMVLHELFAEFEGRSASSLTIEKLVDVIKECNEHLKTV
ncbi:MULTISPECIES: hypothetical protein [Vibrio]|uniref:hypothetical protein n=1 Tax=Vibrio TaxID=662 RepID=UPI00038E1CA8|nr:MULTISPECIES: hypothetical protein [Vibrio]EJG0922029.1 hypothetical protein [Vibrio parahaemolyticus O1:K68]EJG0931575.1 hypothetical protein [Vibrio parahaemolyticus O1]EJG0945856.1 hypothetical protein [Vibrio parahaemolyticus O10]EQM49458.1 hypothetical protein D051_3906 [Vibrio parahaemolyticus VPCR-2010]ETZ09181.1 hypothetical protein AJ90_07545 [Vibrio parahaemolyticus M0605]RFD48263.1 hypothetical protein H328_012745 [Vibrio parahaemolyticus 3355]